MVHRDSARVGVVKGEERPGVFLERDSAQVQARVPLVRQTPHVECLEVGCD
jgi:hypothetical protein